MINDFAPKDAFEAWLDAQWTECLKERRETIEFVREQYVMMRDEEGA